MTATTSERYPWALVHANYQSLRTLGAGHAAEGYGETEMTMGEHDKFLLDMAARLMRGDHLGVAHLLCCEAARIAAIDSGEDERFLRDRFIMFACQPEGRLPDAALMGRPA